MKTLLIYLAVILVTIAIWNAYVILWKTENSKKYSKIWHTIGLVLRVLVYAIPFFVLHRFTDVIKWTLVFIAIGGVAYDFIINAIRYYYTGHPNLWYVDNKGWNAAFLNITERIISFLNRIPFVNIKAEPATAYWIFRGAFVVLTIIILFL